MYVVVSISFCIEKSESSPHSFFFYWLCNDVSAKTISFSHC